MTRFELMRMQCRHIGIKGWEKVLIISQATYEEMRGDMLAAAKNGTTEGWTPYHSLSEEQQKIPGLVGLCEGVAIIVDERPPTYV